jgi:hypothetical protein
MGRLLGTLTATALALLALAPPAGGGEQTRETYRAEVEPLCQANRAANERITRGLRRRVNRGMLTPAGKQFIRLSESFGKLVGRLARVPAPSGDEHRVGRWLEMLRLLRKRLRNVGRYFIAGEKIRGNHESILAERAGISANNISIVFHFRHCRIGRFDGSG